MATVHRLLALVLLISMLGIPSASAQGVGVWLRPDCTTLTGPVSGSTVCWDSTRRAWRFWDGTRYLTDAASATQIVNVLDYGATGNGTTDDTAAIQAAITAATGTILFPPGTYRVSSLNLTGRTNLRLLGVGLPTLLANAQSAPSIPVLDLTGASTLTVENLTIQGAGATLPSVAMLVAADNTGTCTRHHFRNMGSVGSWTIAAVAIFGCTNNSFLHVAFQSSANGIPALLVTGIPAAYGLSSPYRTITAGSFTSDNTFYSAEFHGLFAGTTAPTVILDTMTGAGFYGGVLSSSGGPRIVEFRNIVREIRVEGTFIESESGTPPTDTFFVTATGTVQGLALRNLNMNNGVSATGGIIAGASGGLYRGLEVSGYLTGANNLPAGARLIRIANHAVPTTVIINNAFIMASGLDIQPGGSLLATMILNAGAINLPAGAILSGTLTAAVASATALNLAAQAGGTYQAIRIFAGGITGGDIPQIQWLDAAGATMLEIWTDASGVGTSRIKSRGGLSLHAGNVGVSATNEFLTLQTTGAVGIGTQTTTNLSTGQLAFGETKFTALPAAPDGSMLYCSNCAIANPCAGAGTGALAKRLAGAWVCN